MKIIAERRKANFFIAIAMATIFALGLIFVLKYYDLQRKYYDLLKSRARGIPVQAIKFQR